MEGDGNGADGRAGKADGKWFWRKGRLFKRDGQGRKDPETRETRTGSGEGQVCLVPPAAL